MAASIEELCIKQTVLADKLEQSIKNGRRTRLEKRTVSFYESQIANLGKIWADFDAHDTKLREAIIASKEICTHNYILSDTYSGLEVKYIEYVGELTDGIVTKSPKEATGNLGATSTIIHTNSNHSQLPRINLPKFNGEYSSWRSFRDLYISLVHNNTQLPAVQKLHHLKGCLTGEAERLLKHIPITAEDYEPAWEKLKLRYENKRVLVNTQLKFLTNQPKLTTENAKSIKFLMDTTEESLQQLKALEVDVSQWDTLLIYLLVQKLPFVTLRLWEEELGDTLALPTMDQFQKFLLTRFRVLESMSQSTSTKPLIQTAKTYHIASTNKCPACNDIHYVGICNAFTKMSILNRRKCIEDSGRCFNCFSNKHSARQCPNSRRCKTCNGLHHTLLHTHATSKKIQKESEVYNKQTEKRDNLNTRSAKDKEGSSGFKPTSNNYVEEKEETKSFLSTKSHNALLATAVVEAKDRNGRSMILRCLVDPGSQTSFITQNICKQLGLKERPTRLQITGLNKSKTAWSNQQVTVNLTSCKDKDKCIKVDMLVINKITDHLPTAPMPRKPQWNHLNGINLADPNYWKPGAIDVLLGAQVYANIILKGLRKGPKHAPIAINTIFGWIILGNSHAPAEQVETFTVINQSIERLNHQLKQFWETEEISSKPMMKPEDQECEKIFKLTHRRLENGQYQVELPFKNESKPSFGPTRHVAVKRFEYLKNRFKDDQNLEREYTKCLDEYISLGHMEEIDPTMNADVNDYYIPHHAVFKESTTTKLRIVFDASAKSYKGKSLNEQLLVGPTIQPKLFSTLLKWRKYKIAMTADIEKMYRMISMHPKHRIFQRVIWQNPVTKNRQDYQLTTVTFGTSSAPYLAIRTLQQLAIDEMKNWPLASKAALTDFYVDDLLTGADTVEEAKVLQHQCINMLKAGNFNLRKWASNNTNLLQYIPIEHQELQSALNFNEHEVIKTLGIRWHPALDYFNFVITPKQDYKVLTKRSILSEVATLYDPLGWIAPVIIVAKLLIQSLWISGCSWDTSVEENIAMQWQQFKEALKELEKIKIPRWVGTTRSSASIQLHGFCDASSKAYAAVVYVRVQNVDGTVTSHMLTSKTKVAPIRPITVPRLELNGAVILARLIKSTMQDMQLENVTVIAWSDSMITLQWIRSHPSKWKTYVANRVVEIQDIVAPETWRHVPTICNPADIASRGVRTEELLDNKLWWHGPTWLTKGEEHWPKINISSSQPQLEAKKVVIATFHNQTKSDILFKYSSFVKLARVIAMIKRFIHNCINNTTKINGLLSTTELQAAQRTIFRLVQRSIFTKEYDSLKAGTAISRKSHLLSLNPFLDDHGILRVGGRLEHANIPYARKHPIILPKDHHITTIIIKQVHIDTLHGGVGLTLNTSRHLYWILNGRRTVGRIINQCKACVVQRQQTRSQLMGNLPAPRVNISKPFTHVGVDYAGPINIKTSPHRAARIYKGYFCIFVCMATKAIHVELVSDLTSSAFIAAFKRFVSRRGLCTNIYSDCGTNFKGANKNLHQEIVRAVREASPQVAQYLNTKNIAWHFNPPASPHFGGLWEAGVKSVKHHLRRVVGQAIYTFEEYSTLLTQIEACVNSRPLCPIGNNVEDLSVLTPGHFIIGQALNAVPEPEMTEKTVSPAQRWKHMQYLVQQFWNKWSKDYLHQLQQRPKWCETQPNIKVGDIVLLKEENAPPTFWPLGRIEEVYPGADGLVRVVQVRTSTNSYRRPIAKICRLPMESTETHEE